jgi:16S rRNA processing protein RimM
VPCARASASKSKLQTERRVVVGRVGRPHGLDGAFFVEQPSSDPRWFKPGARLWVGEVELEVVIARRGSGRRPVIRLEREVARGAPLEVPLEALPPTEEGEYYTFQLVGLEVVEEGGRALGRVATVEPGVANDSIALEGGQLLPLVEACVRDIDLEAGRIIVAPGFSNPDD